jgi:hypothetical protein
MTTSTAGQARWVHTNHATVRCASSSGGGNGHGGGETLGSQSICSGWLCCVYSVPIERGEEGKSNECEKGWVFYGRLWPDYDGVRVCIIRPVPVESFVPLFLR